ncbi:MAG: heavy metal translocating P-type ATPase [Defluviitaleaceae bacterium]|nr:heavy metal translocating P-type ATPase [Defluviitaleaceae bacterium]
MRYKIVYDKPGRLRLRMGWAAFSTEEGYGIEEMLLAYPWVKSAEASHVNGGLLVHYESGNDEAGEGAANREKILHLVAELVASNLPKGQRRDENIIREMDDGFFRSLTALILRHFAMKIFVPVPIRTIFTIKNALSYWKNGFAALASGKLNVNVLDAAAVGASVARKDFATAASIMTLLKITEILEDYTRKKARHELSRSLELNIDNVWLVSEDADTLLPLSQVQIGDIVRVRAGWVVPLDGEVCAGEAMVNEASMTGEPLAVLRKPGHSVYAGTVVEEGSIALRVRTLADNTRIQQIVAMIDHSEALKAGIQGRAEKLADAIVPYSFLAFAATLAFTGNMAKAMSVLMVDYSCAIKLTTPICIITAIREAANRRILIKGGKHLEAFATADTIVFDKTGTLTAACPQVAKVIPIGGHTREDILRVSACLEEHFPHSVAKAIVRQAEAEGLHHLEEHADVEYIVAHGIASTLDGERVLIGSSHFIFEDEKIPWPEDEGPKMAAEAEGYSGVYLAIGGKAAGLICVEDPVREDAREVLSQLKALGLARIIMLTGDGSSAATAVSDSLGITEFRAHMLPEDKAAFVRGLKESGHTVIMVGDGINDSPALSCADVSVAMKDGSDIAKEVADITLLGENLDGLITLRRLSQSLLARVQRNYYWILGINTSLLGLGLAGAIAAPTSAVVHNISTMTLSGLSMRPYVHDDST